MYYLSEINALHPFREGNDRTQRAFISQVAAKVLQLNLGIFGCLPIAGRVIKCA